MLFLFTSHENRTNFVENVSKLFENDGDVHFHTSNINQEDYSS